MISPITLLLLLLLLLQPLGAFQFNYATFHDTSNFSTSGNVTYSPSGSVSLSPDPHTTQQQYINYTGSRLAYNQAIQFIHPARPSISASFSTSFTFQIITTASYGYSADGLAFFIAPSSDLPHNSSGEFLGLINGTTAFLPSRHLFAVEFDTFKNLNIGDPSSSHVGIDIGTVKSSASVDTNNITDLNLYQNYTFAAWIDYNASRHLIEVRLTNSSLKQRPQRPCLSLVYNLSSVFQGQMYVGFSAATGRLNEGHILYSWNFSTTGLETATSHPCRFCKRNLGLAVGLSICFLAACVGLIVAVWYYKVRPQKQRDEESFDFSLRRYSYKELKRATQGFNEKLLLGRGAFGGVYKGILRPDGTTVAIKRLNKVCGEGEAEFPSEIRVIGRVRHRNLLQLQGWCYEKGKALLVYEYMANRSLDKHLFDDSEEPALTWATRFNILLGIAAALEYLHEGLGECVLHRDVKAANVLLNANFEAFLGDFGLARLIGHDQIVSMTAAGTPGYVAPEVSMTGKGTDRADVYSFGVLALEVACGRRVLNYKLQPQETYLLRWVWWLQESNRLLDAIDPRLVASTASEVEQWRCVLHVALLCCHPDLEARPGMRQVHQVLKEGRILPLSTTRPVLDISSFSSASITGISSTIGGSSASTSAAMPTSSTSVRSMDRSVPALG